METITVSYTYKIQFWISEDICLTKCGKVINAKKGIELSQFLHKGHPAVYINRKPVNIKDLKEVERNVCPF